MNKHHSSLFRLKKKKMSVLVFVLLLHPEQMFAVRDTQYIPKQINYPHHEQFILSACRFRTRRICPSVEPHSSYRSEVKQTLGPHEQQNTHVDRMRVQRGRGKKRLIRVGNNCGKKQLVCCQCHLRAFFNLIFCSVAIIALGGASKSF